MDWAFNRLYNYVDEDKDGKIDKDEIEDFIKDLRTRLTAMRVKLRLK